MPEGKNYAELQAALEKLQRENCEIRQSLNEIANANLLPSVVQHGFEDVIAQLRPLRDLTIPRESVEDPRITEAADAMLEAMKGVKLTGDSLVIPQVNVPFMGQPRPVPSKPCSDDEPQSYPGQPDQHRTDQHKTPDPTRQQQQPFQRGFRP